MALATIQECKDFLRVQTTTEDASFFTPHLARVKGAIERELGYALTAVARTHTNYSERDNYGVSPVLSLPGPFKTTSPAPVVTDVDGSTVDSANYVLDALGMRIRAKPGVSFPRRPYTIVATIGLDVHPDYAARLEGIANQAIIEFVAQLYQNRSIGVNNESDEGGGSRTYSSIGSPPLIPKRVMDWIDELPGRAGGIILA